MRCQRLIQDNQKNFSRLQMLIDVIVLAVSYISAWFLRFMGPFAYSAEQGLSFEQYMLALIFIIPVSYTHLEYCGKRGSKSC